MKYITLIFFALFIPSATRAQTDNEAEIAALMAELAELETCYHKNFSRPLEEVKLKIGNKDVRAATELHFDTKLFHVADIDEVREISFLSSDNKADNTFSIADYHTLGDVFNPKEIDILQSHYYTRPNTFHLLGHGIVEQNATSAKTIQIDGTEIEPKEMAETMLDMMKKSEGFSEARGLPMTVVVHSCYAGAGADSFAAKLSEELAKASQVFYVVAAPNKVYASIDIDEGYLIEKIAADENAAIDDNVRGENWLIFRSGKIISEGKPSFDDTVSMVENLHNNTFN